MGVAKVLVMTHFQFRRQTPAVISPERLKQESPNFVCR